MLQQPFMGITSNSFGTLINLALKCYHYYVNYKHMSAGLFIKTYVYILSQINNNAGNGLCKPTLDSLFPILYE